jgi:hypothetical protein
MKKMLMMVFLLAFAVVSVVFVNAKCSIGQDQAPDIKEECRKQKDDFIRDNNVDMTKSDETQRADKVYYECIKEKDPNAAKEVRGAEQMEKSKAMDK